MGAAGVARPIVLSKDECGEVHFMGEREEAFEGSGPGIEGGCLRFHLRDFFETARKCLQ